MPNGWQPARDYNILQHISPKERDSSQKSLVRVPKSNRWFLLHVTSPRFVGWWWWSPLAALAGDFFWCAEWLALYRPAGPQAGHSRECDLSEIGHAVLGYLDFFSILCAPPANQEKRRGKRCRLISWFPEWKVGWPNMNFITVISSNFDKRSRNLAKKQVTPKKTNEHRWACICVHSECSVSRELKTARSARLATESYIYLSITLIAHCT